LISGSNSICSGNTTNYNFNTSITNMIVTFDWVATSSNANISGYSATGSTSVLPLLISDVLTNLGNNIGTVTYTITPSGGGCTGQPLVVVDTVKPIPVAIVVNNNPQFCSGNITSIDVSSQTTGTIFNVNSISTSGNVSGLLSINNLMNGATITQTLTVNTTSTAQYTITPVANGCIGSSIIDNVTVYEMPVSVAGKDASYCDGDSAKIGTTNNNLYSYLWSPATYLSNNTISDPITYADKPVNYIVTTSLISYLACKSTDSVNVEVSPQFTIDAGLNQLSCANEVITLTAYPAGLSSYIWTDSTSNKTYNGQTIQIQIGNTAKYYLVATNALNGGCKAKDSVTINIKNNIQPTLFIPNAFTPNANDLNDVFQVYGKEIELFEGAIFDRWGELIYSWNDINSGWDGTYKGNPVEEGVYVYKIKVKNICENNFRDAHLGTVSVIR
jgi:gliding motility-associated-like protein